MRRKRGLIAGQIAIEYLSIMGFVMVLVIFLVYTSQYYSRQVQDTTALNQVDKIAKQIVDAAEQVYYLGQPSRLTLSLYIPDRIDNISISNNEVTFIVRTQDGRSDMNYPSKVNISGNISASQGVRDIKVEARQGYVWISN